MWIRMFFQKFGIPIRAQWLDKIYQVNSSWKIWSIIRQVLKISSNPFLMFRDFTWRRIGKEDERKNFPYLSTLSRNSGNGFELNLLYGPILKPLVPRSCEKSFEFDPSSKFILFNPCRYNRLVRDPTCLSVTQLLPIFCEYDRKI